VAAAMAFRRLGAKFEVVDAGFDLEPERESKAKQLAKLEPQAWSEEDRNTLFPAPKTSAKGVEKRFAFGSDFPYRMPAPLELRAENCVVDVSHGFGGFGNVWGTAVLPYTDNDLVGWPIGAKELLPSYSNVSQFVPISSVADDLERHFPRFNGDGGGLIASRQIQGLARAFDRRKGALQQSGIWAGRSRVAVDSSGGPTTCRYCGYCLDGCAYGSIFNPRRLWKRLEAEGAVIHRNLYALEFREREGGVDTTLLDLKSGQMRVLRARRVFLGTGAINSTRIVARSLRLEKKPIRLKDSQYFFFPYLSYRKNAEPPSFTLAEMFVEILNPALGPYFIHFQLYGLNSIFRQTIKAMVPSFLRRRVLLDQVEKRFILFQGFLHSESSGEVEFTLELREERKDKVLIRGIENPDSLRVARGAQRLLRKKLILHGIIPPVYLKMVPLGRSFHMGGSFPKGGQDAVFRSDRRGRPANLSRVHLLDAATFPSIPATTITFSIMANADRIVTESVGSSE
jgi:hypothetical protein